MFLNYKCDIIIEKVKNCRKHTALHCTQHPLWLAYMSSLLALVFKSSGWQHCSNRYRLVTLAVTLTFTRGIMATSDLTLEQIYNYFKENGNVVKNRELVHHFKHYLTDPASKGNATPIHYVLVALFWCFVYV